MKDDFKLLYRTCQSGHRNLYNQVRILDEEVPKLGVDEQVDLLYTLRESIELIEDARKAMSELQRRLTQVVSLEQMRRLFEEQNDEPIRTEHCTASHKVKRFAKYPHKRRSDPEAYDKLMASLGVPDEISKAEVLRINWNGFCEWFTEQQAAGLPVPDGIPLDKTYNDHEISIRKRKGILE